MIKVYQRLPGGGFTTLPVSEREAQHKLRQGWSVDPPQDGHSAPRAEPDPETEPTSNPDRPRKGRRGR